MAHSIRIFKSLSEQEQYHKQLTLKTTVAERFRKLYQMQQFTKMLHPIVDDSSKINIRKWTS